MIANLTGKGTELECRSTSYTVHSACTYIHVKAGRTASCHLLRGMDEKNISIFLAGYLLVYIYKKTQECDQGEASTSMLELGTVGQDAIGDTCRADERVFFK